MSYGHGQLNSLNVWAQPQPIGVIFTPNWKHTVLNTESMSIPQMKLGHAWILGVFLQGTMGKEMTLTFWNHMKINFTSTVKCHMRDSTEREFHHLHLSAA